MLSRTITFPIDNASTAPTSVVLADPGNVYGVERNDNDAVIVAAGTVMMLAGVAGKTYTYSYTFPEPAAGLSYTYQVKMVYLGQTLYSGALTLAADDGVVVLAISATYGSEFDTLPSIVLGTGETRTICFTVANPDGSAYPLDGKNVQFSAATIGSQPAIVIDEDGVPTSGNTATVTLTAGAVGQTLRWVLKDLTSGARLGTGSVYVMLVALGS